MCFKDLRGLRYPQGSGGDGSLYGVLGKVIFRREENWEGTEDITVPQISDMEVRAD